MFTLPAPADTHSSTRAMLTTMLGLYLVLLAFFILLCALSVPNADKLKQAQSSMASAFNLPTPEQLLQQQQVVLAADVRSFDEALSARLGAHLGDGFTGLTKPTLGRLALQLQPEILFEKNDVLTPLAQKLITDLVIFLGDRAWQASTVELAVMITNPNTEISLAQTGTLTTTFLAAGLPVAQLSAGVDQGSALVEFGFTLVPKAGFSINPFDRVKTQ